MGLQRSLWAEMTWPSTEIFSHRRWLADSGEEQEILSEAVVWVGDLWSRHFSQEAEMIAPGGRLLSVSMVLREVGSEGLKSPLQGTNLRMRLKVLALTDAD